MRGLSLSISLAMTLGLSACNEPDPDAPRDYNCVVTWVEGDIDDGLVLGTANFEYPDLDAAEDATVLCDEEQETHEDRPLLATGWRCECSTDEVEVEAEGSGETG
jgi:hypothetical protein